MKVQFKKGTQYEFDQMHQSIIEHEQQLDPGTIYICIDSGKIYLGEDQICESDILVDADASGKTITFTTHGGEPVEVVLDDMMTSTEIANAIQNALSSTFRLMGTVNTYADLPQSPSAGYVYIVKEAYDDNPAGTSYVWDGTSWQVFGSQMDLSGYIEKVNHATRGNIAIFNSDGSISDRGIAANAFKPIQTPVSSPQFIVSDSSTEFISSISQDRYGVISPEKRSITIVNGSNNGLMTSALFRKLERIADGAQVNVKPDWTAGIGTDAEILNKPSIPTQVSELEDEHEYRNVKSNWNETNEQDDSFILNKPAIKAGEGGASIVEGDLANTASGDWSHAEGYRTITNNDYEHTEGTYNKSNTVENSSFGDGGNTLSSIGFGERNDNVTTRKNAFEVMQNGDVYVYGVGGYDGTNPSAERKLQANLGSANLVSITYSELKSLRYNDALNAGMWYRITDYACTTAQVNTHAESNVFDILVRADDESNLNENAFATHHDSDTYFADCKLETWELKYCIDNDTNRFAWADSSNGKGVVFYMKDEWGNECPYDFKNIQFTISGENYYTFDAYVDSIHYDLSVAQNGTRCYGNIIGEYYNSGSNKLALNTIVFKNTALISECHNNTFGNDCYSNTFGNCCNNNTFGNDCYSSTLGNECYNNTFGNSCNSNTFGNQCNSNTFGNYCHRNTFGNNCQYNTFRDWCYSNTFGDFCSSNTFGNECYSNTFGDFCYHNTFGNGCSVNTFNANCNSNTFGTNCSSNTFGNWCHNNTFGNECYSNTFGNYIQWCTIFEGVIYCDVASGTSALNVQYCQILNGTRGTNTSDKLAITFETGKAYTQVAGKDSDGSLQIWIAADGIIDVASDWEAASGESGYIANKPAIKAGDGTNSIVEGDLTQNAAKGQCSHTEGNGTEANNYYEHAEGAFNKSNNVTHSIYPNAGNTLSSIGFGTSSTDRKNAFEVMQNGDMYVYGIGGYDGTNPTSATSLKDYIGDIESLLAAI